MVTSEKKKKNPRVGFIYKYKYLWNSHNFDVVRIPPQPIVSERGSIRPCLQDFSLLEK